MKCTQINCGKKFEKSLILYNGALVCPHCKKELTVVSDFKITERNQEIYNLSELYLHRYLSPKSQDETRGAVIKLRANEMIGLAIDNCNTAAKEGNPYAVYRMGYYNEYFLESQRGETDRIRVAFNYYSSLCYSEAKKVKVEQGASAMSEEEFERLKRQAAIALLTLYDRYPQALKGSTRYDYEKNKQRITSIYGDLPVEVNLAKKRASGHTQNVFRILLSCLNRNRAPLWGLFLLTGSELKSLFLMKKDQREKKPELYKLISKGVHLRYLPCDSEGVIAKDLEDRYFINFPNNEERVKEMLQDIKDDENLYLYLFNTKGGHEYLSASQIKKIGIKLASNSYESVCSLIDYSAQEYLFFDDDIFVYKRGIKIEKCVDVLIEKISGDE
ncbi:MAG: hypothetical protein IKV61_03965 [Clostridia bacterium]|nr:hypothetical protein [Clostridia bacterium]